MSGSTLKQPDVAVDVFFALGDETRLSVVRKLAAGAGVAQSATALSDGAQVTRQAIVKHLQVLESAGLVSHEKRGREVLYALEVGRLHAARAFLDGISAGWDRAIDRLRALVEEPPRRPATKRRRV
jgi:DNA-binding transcriptional ArsR family regulator